MKLFPDEREIITQQWHSTITSCSDTRETTKLAGGNK